MLSLKIKSSISNKFSVVTTSVPTRERKDLDPVATRRLEGVGRECDKSRQDALREQSKWEYRENGVTYVGNTEVGFERAQSSLQGLDISTKFQRESLAAGSGRRKGYGLPTRDSSISRDARNRLYEYGACLDKILVGEGYGSYLYTFTLPGDNRLAFDALARWSGYICNRLLQGIRRKKAVFHWFYVWERQKRGALHLHLVVASQGGEGQLCLGEQLRDAWSRALCYIDEEEGGVVFSASQGDRCTLRKHWQFDARPADGRVGRYLAKYLGKGTFVYPRKDGDTRTLSSSPHRWHGCSRILSGIAASFRAELSLEGLSQSEVSDCMDAIEATMSAMGLAWKHQCRYDIVSKKSGAYIGWVESRVAFCSDEEYECTSLLWREMAWGILSTFDVWRVHYNRAATMWTNGTFAEAVGR